MTTLVFESFFDDNLSPNLTISRTDSTELHMYCTFGCTLVQLIYSINRTIDERFTSDSRPLEECGGYYHEDCHHKICQT